MSPIAMPELPVAYCDAGMRCRLLARADGLVIDGLVNEFFRIHPLDY